MSCSTSTPSVMRPGSVSSSRFSYSTLTMMTVLDERAGDAEIQRVEMPAAHRQADPDKEQYPEQARRRSIARRRQTG